MMRTLGPVASVLSPDSVVMTLLLQLKAMAMIIGAGSKYLPTDPHCR